MDGGQAACRVHDFEAHEVGFSLAPPSGHPQQLPLLSEGTKAAQTRHRARVLGLIHDFV